MRFHVICRMEKKYTETNDISETVIELTEKKTNRSTLAE